MSSLYQNCANRIIFIEGLYDVNDWQVIASVSVMVKHDLAALNEAFTPPLAGLAGDRNEPAREAVCLLSRAPSSAISATSWCAVMAPGPLMLVMMSRLRVCAPHAPHCRADHSLRRSRRWRQSPWSAAQRPYCQGRRRHRNTARSRRGYSAMHASS